MSLTEAQANRILKSRSKCEGEKIRIEATDFSGNQVRGMYTIGLGLNYAGDATITLTPSGEGSTASSDETLDSYAFENGGNLFRAAVRAAKEIAKIV